MSDSKDQNKEAEQPAKPPLPKGEKFFDPWDEEFRRSFNNKTFEF
ncbi:MULTISPECIES: hypothetical protein [Rhizobium]|nr:MULTISPECIES: hypothetical protein [Rhizobium]